MQRPLKIIILGLLVGSIMAIGLYVANYLGITPMGRSFNNFFAMVGIIICIISGFFFLSMETLQSK
jgi:hypothetical protein